MIRLSGAFRFAEPRDRAIRHRQHGVPHSQFAWVEPPRNALVVKKPNDKNTTTALVRVVDMLVKQNVTPWVEPAVHWETSVGRTWSLDDDPRLDKTIDFIVCLGGDGTILWVSNLFPKAVPPVISFAMGSLGFLTAFEEESIPRAVGDVVRGDFFFTPRSRLAAHVVDARGVEEKRTYVCLNEVVIDRGASAALVDLDVNIDGSPMTKVLADGVMISTPTGSTAYSLAAGGSMVHPGVSGVLFVPICPHTLSFRPLVLPDTSVLTVRVPESARVEPVASFDGKRQRTLRRGESLVIALTSSLIASVKLNAGYVVVQNLIVIICEYLQNEFASVMAFLMATFLAGVLPTALTDAVTTGVTNLLLPKLTTALTGPVMGYHYCVYCYYYGDFCQSCFWNNDLTWMDRDWWLSPQQETYT